MQASASGPTSTVSALLRERGDRKEGVRGELRDETNEEEKKKEKARSLTWAATR